MTPPSKPNEFPDDMTLKEARDLLRTKVDDGHNCPCCRQFAKVYKRKINTTQARQLIACYRAVGALTWFHRPTVLPDSSDGEFAKLRYWGLIEEEREMKRADGGRAGWYQITSTGELWVKDQTTVEKYARIYDGRCLGFDGPNVGIRESLGRRFNYTELMEGV